MALQQAEAAISTSVMQGIKYLALCLSFGLLSNCQSRLIDNSLLGPQVDVSYSLEVQPLFSRSCGGGGCHFSSSQSGVNLSSYQQVITSIGVAYGRLIVDPGDGDTSPVIDKMRVNPQFGGRMPIRGGLLTSDEVGIIKTWIDEGALNN